MNELQDLRVLVVEDNVVNIAIVSTILQSSGAMVIQDYWQSSTIDMVQSHLPIDIILLDLMLANGKSGYDVFAELQEDEALKNIPVVIVSASDAGLEIPKAKALGLTGYIAKPINLNDFPKQIKQAIEGTPTWISG